MKLKPGSIPNGWEATTLGSICGRITTGKLDANAMVADGAYPFFTCARENYWIDKYAFDYEALLVSGNGANVGYVHYYNGKFNAYQRTYVISEFSTDVQYLRLFLESNLGERIRVEVNAGNTPYITMGTLTEMVVVLPRNKVEQRAIAEALTDVDALLVALGRLIAKKRDLKQAAMQQLLTGKTRLPGFRGEWDAKAFHEVCWFQEGPGVRNTQFTASGIKLLNGTNIFRGVLDLDTTSRFISEREGHGAYAHFLADEGDIVLACSGITIERLHQKVAFVRARDLPFCMNTSTIRFKPLAGLVPTFLFQFLTGVDFKRMIGGAATGSAQLNFGPSHLAKVELLVPPLPEQTAIAEVLSEMDAEIAALEQRREKTRALKQGMMQELLTGEDATRVSNAAVTYYVDEAGDGVLFGPMGRDRLADPEAAKFFMLGMVRCADDEDVARQLAALRAALRKNPLYATIHSLRPEEQKTARAFHAKDDHPEIRSKVFELLATLDFKFYALIKDMRAVRDYVNRRNSMESGYRYHPNELYDLTVRMLFKQRLHKEDHYRVVFARRGKSDRTEALTRELENTRERFLTEHEITNSPTLEIRPAYPWEQHGIQVADYALWALQRCYERQEARFLNAIWAKVSLIHDVDDPDGASYGRYMNRKGQPPDPEKIKSRWI